LYAPKLIGADPLCTQRLWEELYWSDAHWVGSPGITRMAWPRCAHRAVDLKAKSARRAAYRLGGGHKDGRVPSYNTDGGC